MAASGKVSWFNEHKGYGFIQEPEGREVLVRHIHIRMDGFRTLKPGTVVAYELVEGEHGVEATEVTPLP